VLRADDARSLATAPVLSRRPHSTSTGAATPLTLIVGIAASTAVLVAVAVADTVREVEQAPSTSR
jgi:hypothetical protein